MNIDNQIKQVLRKGGSILIGDRYKVFVVSYVVDDAEIARFEWTAGVRHALVCLVAKVLDLPRLKEQADQVYKPVSPITTTQEDMFLSNSFTQINLDGELLKVTYQTHKLTSLGDIPGERVVEVSGSSLQEVFDQLLITKPLRT